MWEMTNLYKKPVYKIFFSDEDSKYVAASSDIPGVYALGETPKEAFIALLRLESYQEKESNRENLT